MPQRFNPASLFEGTYDLCGNRHTADIFDIAASNGLTPGNNRQRLEDRTRIPRRSLGVESGQIDLHLRPALKPPAISDLYEFETPALPVKLEHSQVPPYVICLNILPGKQSGELGH